MRTGAAPFRSFGGSRSTGVQRSVSFAVRPFLRFGPPQAGTLIFRAPTGAVPRTWSRRSASPPGAIATLRLTPRRARTSSAAPVSCAREIRSRESPSRSQTVTTRVSGQAAASACARSRPAIRRVLSFSGACRKAASARKAPGGRPTAFTAMRQDARGPLATPAGSAEARGPRMTGQSLGSGFGSSPRGRGTDLYPRSEFLVLRFIPAWAGNSTPTIPVPGRLSVHPRVGGEQAAHNKDSLMFYGSSPRGRGTGAVRGRRQRGRRFIPAWAGNRIRHMARHGKAPVHPRVGGEQVMVKRGRAWIVGSSPRGRGTGHGQAWQSLDCRFIPAWAGNRRTGIR